MIFGQELASVAEYLKGYDAIHMVCDGNVSPFAIAVAQAVTPLDEDAREHHCCHEEGRNIIATTSRARSTIAATAAGLPSP